MLTFTFAMAKSPRKTFAFLLSLLVLDIFPKCATRGRTNQIKSNSVPQGSYIQYNTDTHELKLKPGSDSSRSSSSSTKNNNQGSQGAFFTYDPATQKLKLSKDTGTSATNSNSPYQAKVPSSPFSGSKGRCVCVSVREGWWLWRWWLQVVVVVYVFAWEVL